MNTFLPESQLLVLLTRLHVLIEVTMKLTGNKIFPYFEQCLFHLWLPTSKKRGRD